MQKIITEKEKKEVCDKHIVLLKVLHKLGNGVMLNIQISKYLCYFLDWDNNKVHRALKELEEKEIINIRKYHNSNYIYFRKYGSRYMKQLENPKVKLSNHQVANIKVNDTIIKKSMFINQYIIKKYIDNETIQAPKEINDFILFIRNNTTLLEKRYNLYTFLEKVPQTKEIKRECYRLKEIENIQLTKLKNTNRAKDKYKKEAIAIAKAKEKVKEKDKGEEEPIKKMYDLNNMYSSNINIFMYNKTNIGIVLMDINNNFTPVKIAKYIKKVYEYLEELETNINQLEIKKEVRFTIVTAKDSYRINLTNKPKEIFRELGSLKNKIKIGIVTLELDKECFANSNVLL